MQQVEMWNLFLPVPTETASDEREAVQLERLRLAEANKTRMCYISSIAHDLKT